MIALLLDSALPQSVGSTSQPTRQKCLRMGLSSPLRLIPECSITVATPLQELSHPSIARDGARKPWRVFAESKTHSFSSSSSPDHSVLSNNVLPNNDLCLVCCVHSSVSCPVCEQNFCSNHLYACLDCDSQFCSSCFNDHLAGGHWTDSDTNAERSHGWREDLVSGVFRIGIDRSVSASNRAQCFCGDQFAYQSHSSIIRVLPNERATKAKFGTPLTDRNYCAVYDTYPNQAFASTSGARNQLSSRISHFEASRPEASFFARAMRAVCSCVAAQALVNLFSQFQSLEVCL